MSEPHFAIAVTFEIKPPFVEQFRARVIRQASDSVEREPGCCQFDVLVDDASPTTFFLYETYVDVDAFAVHQQTDHFADFQNAIADWVSGKQVRRLTIQRR